ncbi:zinc ribbon domain-containing protein [Victivallis sp. Marseille-Q1083]|uniref:zinc-ribbon domain-containing protein n=1 Tax=Victivallis sp. Marseille-Q1083 TaxID=2717288 RepID=UPI00158D7553|nr:zinc ribbon domain-containing protein [Victivallis sp. Marseille-Q1083]
MKQCDHCGSQLEAGQHYCPNCGTMTEPEPSAPPVRCPNCGSTQISAVRREYSPGCGCLGWLLFGWWGLLLGLLGGSDIEMVCNHCGTRWPAGEPQRARSGIGCLGVLLLALLIWVLCNRYLNVWMFGWN